MGSALARIPLSIALLMAGCLSIWIASRAYRGRHDSGPAEPVWPFEFSVYTLDYYLGPRLARFARVAQVAGFAPYCFMGAADLLFGDGQFGVTMFFLLLSFVSAVFAAFLPILCRLDERGIRYQNQIFPWDTLRRWNVNFRRLQIVAARAQNRELTFTIEIPLNGLAPALVPWLDEQIAAHTGKCVVVTNPDAQIAAL